MKTKSTMVVILLLSILNVFGQKLSIDLNFSAENNGAFVKLDSIKVMNRSQGIENTIIYPDTSLSLEVTPGDTLLYIGYTTGYPVGVQEILNDNSAFRFYQGFPNPVKDHSTVSINLPADGDVTMRVIDIQGRVVLLKNLFLGKGVHAFRFSPGSNSFYFLSASWGGLTESTKIINAEPSNGKTCGLDYIGSNINNHSLKKLTYRSDFITLESGIIDTPTSGKSYKFQFATIIPCPGIPTVEYEGQVYHTIQIFSQCWIKENLNVGTMVPGTNNQLDNGIKEKYCYNNETDSCTKYGGLYQWNEMMQYATQQGAQGICPAGWHLPTDEEWKILEGAADSLFGIGESIWDGSGVRGYNSGIDLKTTTGWNYNGNGTDLFGFSGAPGGLRMISGGFTDLNLAGYWWTSSMEGANNSWFRSMGYNEGGFYRLNDSRATGFSVRCIRNN